MYCKPKCKYCDMAKELLDTRNVQYDFLTLDHNDKSYNDQLADLRLRYPRQTTFPYVIVDKVCIGGYRELKNLLVGPRWFPEIDTETDF